MKCSRCGTKLEVLFEDDVRDDGTPFTEKAVDPCPKCCAARKPIQWHPPTEKPERNQSYPLIFVVNESGWIVKERRGRVYSGDIAWCYADALVADARAAMEGEG